MMHAAGGRRGKAWTPTEFGGSPSQPGVRPSAAAEAHLGGDGYLRRRWGGCGGEEGHGVHAGRGGGGAVGRLAGARARGWGSGVPSRERHRSADRGGGAAGAGQSRPGSPGRPRRWGPRSAEGPAPRSAGTNPAEHHPRGRILVEAGGSATPSPRGRTGPGRAPPDGYRGGGRGWAPGLRGPGPWWLWTGAGETGRAHGLRLVRGGAWKGRAGSRANPERPSGAGRGLPRAAVP